MPCFNEFEETRYKAGFSISETCTTLAISNRTFARWRKNGKVPKMAILAIRVFTGELTTLGWKNWEIRDKKLYCNDLAAHYYWEPGDLIASLYHRINTTGTPPKLQVIRGKAVDGVKPTRAVHSKRSTQQPDV